ncbi:hypothetical protein AAEX28_08660 [Lentisphaerota bacterium WC36G]|nr:hypothetical protein LJT99_11515 [Lentisphaerae bacterium WC36]
MRYRMSFYLLFACSLALLNVTGCSENERPRSFVDKKVIALEKIHPYAFKLIAQGKSIQENVFESIDYKAIHTDNILLKNMSLTRKTSGMLLESTSGEESFSTEVIGKIVNTDSYVVDFSQKNSTQDLTTTERLKVKLSKRQFYFQGLFVERYFLDISRAEKIADPFAEIKAVHPYAIYRLVNGMSFSIGEVNEINYLALMKSNIINNFLIWENEGFYGTKTSDNTEICSYKILSKKKNIYTLEVNVITQNMIEQTSQQVTKKATFQLLHSKDDQIKSIRCLGWEIIPQEKL